MGKKSAHASNAKFQEQQAASTLPEVDKEWIEGEFKKIENKIEHRLETNRDIGDLKAGVAERTGYTKEVIGDMLKRRKRTKESYAQYIHLMNDLCRKLGMQPEYNPLELDKPDISKKIIQDVRMANIHKDAIIKDAGLSQVSTSH